MQLNSETLSINQWKEEEEEEEEKKNNQVFVVG